MKINGENELRYKNMNEELKNLIFSNEVHKLTSLQNIIHKMKNEKALYFSDIEIKTLEECIKIMQEKIQQLKDKPE